MLHDYKPRDLTMLPLCRLQQLKRSTQLLLKTFNGIDLYTDHYRNAAHYLQDCWQKELKRIDQRIAEITNAIPHAPTYVPEPHQ